MKKQLGRIFLTLTMFFAIVTANSVAAIPDSFNQNLVLEDSDFYTLPPIFSAKNRAQSIAVIQHVLNSDGSVLANLNVTIRFGANDAEESRWEDYIRRNPDIKPFLNKTYSVAEFLWVLTQEGLGNGKWLDIPINETNNPLALLALIQKESGLVYGNCSKAACYGQSVGFRLDRATGYACPDGGGCDSEFGSFFKQVYFANRWYKAHMKKCAIGFTGYGQLFKVGSTVTISNIPITFASQFACASHYYTPHAPQRTFYLTALDIYRRAETAVIQPPGDTTPPSVNIVKQTTQNPKPLITGTVDDPAATISFYFQGDFITTLPNKNGSWSYQIVYPKLPGTYQIDIEARDASGNIGKDSTTDELIVTPAQSSSASSSDSTPSSVSASSSSSASLPSKDLANFNPNENQRGTATQITEAFVVPEFKNTIQLTPKKQEYIPLYKDPTDPVTQINDELLASILLSQQNPREVEEEPIVLGEKEKKNHYLVWIAFIGIVLLIFLVIILTMRYDKKDE